MQPWRNIPRRPTRVHYARQFRYGQRGAIVEARRLDVLDKIRALPPKYATAVEVAQAVGIKNEAIWNYIEQYPAFRAAVQSKIVKPHTPSGRPPKKEREILSLLRKARPDKSIRLISDLAATIGEPTASLYDARHRFPSVRRVIDSMLRGSS